MAGRRSNGEGTLRKRVDGRWEGRVWLPGPDGKLKAKAVYGKTRKEAREKLDALQADIDKGMDVMAEKQTVGQFLDRWLEDVARPTTRLRTHEVYGQLIRLHIGPDLGHHDLAKLGPQEVQAFINRKLASGLSPRTVQFLRAILRRALGQALRWGLVNKNAATLVDSPRVVRPEFRSLSPQEAATFLQAVKGDRLEALYVTTLALGLRQGEVLGLRWEDIDLEKRTLRVRVALQRVRGGEMKLVEPKTRQSKRTLPLPALVVDQLKAHRIRQIEDRLRAGDQWVGESWGLVFTTKTGGPHSSRNLVTYFKAILKRSGLPDIRFHDLRHSCASLLVAQGIHPRLVMEQLGHSTITLTMNTYAHVLPEIQRQAADTMDTLLGAK